MSVLKQTIIEQLAEYSIELNGIIYPANSVCNAAITYVDQLYFGNFESSEYPLSRVGSAFKVRSGSRFALVTSDHQHKDFCSSQALLESANTKIWVSGHNVVASRKGNDGPHIDIRLVEFTELVNSSRLSRTGWFELKPFSEPEEILGCVAFGYPTSLNDLYEDEENIKQLCVAEIGEPLGKSFNDLLAMRPDRELEFDPDGLSGGPVFNIAKFGDQFRMIPAGIITNASRTQINFVDMRKTNLFLNFEPDSDTG